MILRSNKIEIEWLLESSFVPTDDIFLKLSWLVFVSKYISKSKLKIGNCIVKNGVKQGLLSFAEIVERLRVKSDSELQFFDRGTIFFTVWRKQIQIKLNLINQNEKF